MKWIMNNIWMAWIFEAAWEIWNVSTEIGSLFFVGIYSMYTWYMYAIVEPVSKKQMKALIMCVITRLTNNMPRNEMLKAQAHFSLFSLLSLPYAIHYNNFHENHCEPYFFFFSSFFCQSLLCHSFFYFHTIWKFPFVHLGIYIMISLRSTNCVILCGFSFPSDAYK